MDNCLVGPWSTLTGKSTPWSVIYSLPNFNDNTGAGILPDIDKFLDSQLAVSAKLTDSRSASWLSQPNWQTADQPADCPVLKCSAANNHHINLLNK